MKKSKKNKLIIILSSNVLLFGCSLSLLSKIPNNNFLNNKPNLLRQDLSNSQYLEAKVDPIYKVKTLRKTGNDKNKINVLFMNDNINDSFNNNENYFSDYVYKDIVIPWFSEKYSYSTSTSFLRLPYFSFQTYLNDKFNVYSIQIPSNKSTNIVKNDKTFFGMYIENRSDNTFQIRNYGRIKKNILTYDINNNFLQDSGMISHNNQNLIYFDENDKASPRAVSRGFSLTAKSDSNPTVVHEFGHSIFNLVDEYDITKGIGPNRSNTDDPNKVSWKEFLNFRGIGIYKTHPQSEAEFIPFDDCLMKASSVSKDFCEVCKHHIFTLVAKTLGDELFYIADPQLTPEHVKWNDESYKGKTIEKSELYSFNIENAKNKKLEFRTVVDNMTFTNKKVKLKITIKNKDGNEKFSKESQEYEIKPKEIKGLVLLTDEIKNDLKNDEDTIIGEVIDVNTNKVLATSLDRLNKEFLQEYHSDTSNKNFGKKFYKININFLDYKTKEPLKDIKSTTIVQKDQTTFKLEKILFQGYRFVSSDNTSMEVTLNGKDVDVDYYYEQLPSKNLKLKLVDENQKSIQEKTVKVYENQKFKPKNSDFLIYDLQNYGNQNSSENKNWTWKIKPPSISSISYDQIQDNQTEIIYTKVSNDADMYISARDQKILQGGDINKFIKFDFNLFNQSNNLYDYDFSLINSGTSVIYNDVNTSKPGNYKITYYSSRYENKVQKDIKVYKDINVRVVPSNNEINELDAEINRLNSLEYLWLKKYDDGNNFMQSEFESINGNNILENLTNLALNKDFTYQVIDFKRENENTNNTTNPFNHYSFKIKVSKNSQTKETNLFTKNIWFKYVNETELDKEVERINQLNLTLINNKFDKETIDSINESNIHQYISNWNQVISNNKFKYEVKNLTKNNGTIRFNILVTENDKNKSTKYFNLPYYIESIEEVLINNEIDRINKIQIELNKNQFTSKELENINQNNFKNLIKNWNIIASNSSLMYKITNFSKTNNKFIFSIEISNSTTNFSKLTKSFEINFSINDSDAIVPPTNNQTNKNNNVGKIVGSVVGSVLGTLLVVGIVFWVLKRKKNK